MKLNQNILLNFMIFCEDGFKVHNYQLLSCNEIPFIFQLLFMKLNSIFKHTVKISVKFFSYLPKFYMLNNPLKDQ